MSHVAQRPVSRAPRSEGQALALRYWSFRLAAAVVPLVPDSWLYPLARAFGTAAFVLAAGARRTAWTNIRPVVQPARRMRTVRQMFVHNAQYYLSLFARRPTHLCLEEHELQGWHHFREALAGGRGCILVSPHLGDINYYAELFLASGYPVNVVVEELRPKALCELVVRLRQRRGVGVIVGGSGALKGIYRVLEANEIVAFISDRDIQGNGHSVTFFGQPAAMPGFAFTLAARRKVPVILGAAVRISPNHVVADVRPPFVPSPDVTANVEAMAVVFEEFISRFPEHWLAFQPIFGGGTAGARPTPRRLSSGVDNARSGGSAGFDGWRTGRSAPTESDSAVNPPIQRLQAAG